MRKSSRLESAVDAQSLLAVEVARPKVIDLEAAAQRIGCSAVKLRRLINRGDAPPFIMVGQSVMFREAAIESWLMKRERESVKILKSNRALVEKFNPAGKAVARR